MARSELIAKLQRHEVELRSAGLASLYLFGSYARSEQAGDSDVDLFFDIGRQDGFTLFKLAALKARCETLLECPVDLMSREAINSRRRPAIEREAVQIF